MVKKILIAIAIFLGVLVFCTGCVSRDQQVPPTISEKAFDWNGKGFDAYVSGNYTEALTFFDKAIEAEPNFSKAWYNRGMTLSQLGRYQEAAESFNKTLGIDPHYPNAREMLSSALSKI